MPSSMHKFLPGRHEISLFPNRFGRGHMNRHRCCPLSCRRNKSTLRKGRLPSKVKTVDGVISLDTFRETAWTPEIPIVIKGYRHPLPAASRWFNLTADRKYSFTPYFEEHRKTILPYEFKKGPFSTLKRFQSWLRSQASPVHRDVHLAELVDYFLLELKNSSSTFHQIDAPLSLLIRALQYNNTPAHVDAKIQHLYVAQSSLGNLPPQLFDDLPVPELVTSAGRGDLYDSSIWLGLQPTYTPLHRDPNPNFFCQMIGSKTVRIIRPELGLAIYSRVRKELGSAGNSRFRGTEMMEGPERDALHRTVWRDGHPEMKEVTLGPRDALFVPKGWWHSVVSTGDQGYLNASVNWWFR
ncbi:JmjC domain-containing protein [Xylariomycetidae sp. FL2044]|nr:JmjC domain-containing protein [Xylariomycetidae sp. FL2044]